MSTMHIPASAATMDLTKWLPLWEKCPELRPVGLAHDFGFWRYFHSCMPEEVVPALIRDRAVWLGFERHNFSVERFDDFYRVRGNTPETMGAVGLSKDPLEALYFAWCGVLGVRP